MRVVAAFVVLLGLLLAATLPSGDVRAGTLGRIGPNPNWTDMQQYEWYIGYLARAAQLCGTFTESAVLHRLARMSPYGGIGLKVIMGDGFSGTACAGINADAREIAADAKKIQEYLEATYSCQGEGCFGQSLSDWKSHDCAETVRSVFASRAIEEEQIDKVSIHNARLMGALQEYQVQVRFKTCEGSLYLDLKESCAIKKSYTRGDCEIAGVERY